MSEAARDFKGEARKFVTAIIRKYEGAHQKVSKMEEAKDAIQVQCRRSLYRSSYFLGRNGGVLSLLILLLRHVIV
jgi:NAD dependent epimerase/dehydratase family enzyme